MIRSVNTLILFCCVLLHTHLANTLQCYKCSGPLNQNSECENLNHIPATPCDNNVCAKFIIKNPGNEILHRSCSPENICIQLETEYQNHPTDSVQECQTCNQDGCNSAPDKTLSLGLGFMTLLYLILS